MEFLHKTEKYHPDQILPGKQQKNIRCRRKEHGQQQAYPVKVCMIEEKKQDCVQETEYCAG